MRKRLIIRLSIMVLVLALVAASAIVGRAIWQRTHRSAISTAVELVPASALRVSFTDWAVVRAELDTSFGADPDRDSIEKFMAKAYDADLSAASSIDESAGALQENFGFSPATATWEAFSQGRQGASMVLKLTDGANFGRIENALKGAGFTAPKDQEGVWQGGPDLIARIDPSITPQQQFVVLLEDKGIVVTSDSPSYVVTAAKAAAGKIDGLGASSDATRELVSRTGSPAAAIVWAKDFACEDLSMSTADPDAQEQAKQAIADAGKISALSGLVLALEPDRSLRVAEQFGSSDQASENLRPRAKLAVGDAVGRGAGSFGDTFSLNSSKTVGSTVLLDLKPKQGRGFILSSLYDGPVIFASC